MASEAATPSVTWRGIAALIAACGCTAVFALLYAESYECDRSEFECESGSELTLVGLPAYGLAVLLWSIGLWQLLGSQYRALAVAGSVCAWVLSFVALVVAYNWT